MIEAMSELRQRRPSEYLAEASSFERLTAGWMNAGVDGIYRRTPAAPKVPPKHIRVAGAEEMHETARGYLEAASALYATQMALMEVAQNVSSLQQQVTHQNRWQSYPWWKRVWYALTVNKPVNAPVSVGK